ncbi:MAG: hypothetical protein AAF417_05390 [Pseudomonadota bacterium]
MDYTIIAISGADRNAFLQGQLTQDVAEVTPTRGLHAAWCNAKGRVLVTCRVFADATNHFLAVPSDVAEDILKRLTMYRLRADVGLAIVDDFELRAYRAEDLPEGAVCVSTPFDKRYVEVIQPKPTTDEQAAKAFLSPAAWAAARCSHGMVEIHGPTAERYTPHMLNLDRCGAISFSKGCYTGQEVVARTEHLGKVKRRIARYRWDGNGVEPDAEVSDGDGTVGQVVNAAGGDVLAVVPVHLHDATLYIGSEALTPQPLPYSS